MIAVLVAVVLWLAVGHAVVAGLYWGLLHVPESNAWMLAMSASLVVLVIVVAGWLETAAALIWAGSYTIGERMRRALRGIPGTVLGLAVFALVWWLTGWAMAWTQSHRGEIDAALMVRFGWTRTRWLHAGIAWFIWFVRYPAGLSLGLAPLVAAGVGGFGAMLRFGWVLRALSPVRLLLTAICLLAFFWLPWTAAFWRPRTMPPTWAEAAFVTAKLVLLYVLMNIGWALILRTAARGARTAAAATPDVPPL